MFKLMKYDGEVDYKIFKQLSPGDYPVVSVYNKTLLRYEDKTVYREYISYGVSPEFKETGKSYMFNNKTKAVPREFGPLLSFAKSIDNRYNNIYVNWYNNGNDYIEPHSDCIASLYKDSKILIININEGDYSRVFKIQHKTNKNDYHEIELINRLCILLDVSDQQHYHHWVDKEDTNQGRISVTFRAIQQ